MATRPTSSGFAKSSDNRGAGLIVDEAHALGVFGPDGRGACAAAGITPDVLVGTLGKAFGAAGAFVVGCRTLTEWLWNRARSHVFSTALSPAIAEAARLNVERSLENPGLRADVLALATRLREGLVRLGLDVRGHGPIIPCVCGDERSALALAEHLRSEGVHVVAIRPPTVPAGTSRLRFSVTARHTPADVDRVVATVGRVMQRT